VLDFRFKRFRCEIDFAVMNLASTRTVARRSLQIAVVIIKIGTRPAASFKARHSYSRSEPDELRETSAKEFSPILRLS